MVLSFSSIVGLILQFGEIFPILCIQKISSNFKYSSKIKDSFVTSRVRIKIPAKTVFYIFNKLSNASNIKIGVGNEF